MISLFHLFVAILITQFSNYLISNYATLAPLPRLFFGSFLLVVKRNERKKEFFIYKT